MGAKPCPSCRKQNCGNHAACARRKAAECSRCKRSPCPDVAYCEGMGSFWQVVATVESVLQDAIKKNPSIIYSHLEPETLSLMRWEIFHLMDKRIRQEENQRQMKALGMMMLRGLR